MLITCYNIINPVYLIWLIMSLNKNKEKSDILRFYFVGFLLFVLSIAVFRITFFTQINSQFIDYLHGDIVPSEDIVIIGIDDKSLKEIGAWPWDRSVYADALKNIENPAVLGFDILFLEEREGDNIFIDELRKVSYDVILASKFSDGEIRKSVLTGENIADGYVNYITDNDGKVRSASLFVTDNSNYCQGSFAFNIVSKFLNIEYDKCEIDLVNVDDNNQIKFNYTDKSFQYYSFVDVYKREVDLDSFNDKIVLIGVTVTDVKDEINDNFIDVFGETTPGVVVHANVINSILQGKMQQVVSYKLWVLIMLTVLLMCTTLYRLVRNYIVDFLIYVLLCVISIILGIVLFDIGINWMFIETFSLLTIFFMYSVAYKYIYSYLENLLIRRAFGQYVNSTLLEKIVENPNDLKLGGQKKEITVMFSDIRGFTTICEQLTPEQVIEVTNLYLDEVTDIILKNNGTVDKYIGDAVMAFWNAPISDSNHRLNAIITAIEMQRQVIDFNKKNKDKFPPIKIGIGLNTGEMVVGNVGSSKRFDYTLIGDEVNLGSRIEGLTKKYGVGIIATEAVVKGITNDKIIFRLLDEVIVKGKYKPVIIYEPMVTCEGNIKIKKCYEEGFRLYQKGEFSKAIKILNSISDIDFPSRLIIDRIEEIKKIEKWDGVWKWTEK